MVRLVECSGSAMLTFLLSAVTFMYSSMWEPRFTSHRVLLSPTRQNSTGNTAVCKSRSMTPSQLAVPKEETRLIYQEAWVLFRGETFRNPWIPELAQKIAWCSIKRHVLLPLERSFRVKSIRIHFCVRPHKNKTFNKSFFVNELHGMSTVMVSSREVSMATAPDQVALFTACMQDIPDHAAFVLVLRPDLVFIDDVNFTGVTSMDMIYMQWNLFSDCVTHQMADQIQLIGGRQIMRFKREIQVQRIDSSVGSPTLSFHWNNSLHNLYRWVENRFGVNALSYLNHYNVIRAYPRL